LEQEVWPFNIPDTPAYINLNQKFQLVSISVHKLIERITHHQTPDLNILVPFLSTFKTFISADELLNLITIR